MLKQEAAPMPEAVAHLRAEALMNGALHAALHWGSKGRRRSFSSSVSRRYFPWRITVLEEDHVSILTLR